MPILKPTCFATRHIVSITLSAKGGRAAKVERVVRKFRIASVVARLTVGGAVAAAPRQVSGNPLPMTPLAAQIARERALVGRIPFQRVFVPGDDATISQVDAYRLRRQFR